MNDQYYKETPKNLVDLALLLDEAGHDTSIEYPGYIQFPLSRDAWLNIGNANGVWEADWYRNGDDSAPYLSFELAGRDAEPEAICAALVALIAREQLS